MPRRLVFRAALGLLLAAPAALTAQSRALSAADRRADVAQLRQLMTGEEKSWTPSALALALARLDSLDRAADTISAVGFELAVARIVATADNGHTVTPAARRAARFNRVGLRLTPLGADFVVMRTRPNQAELLGGRLLAIDGVPLAELRALAHQLNGGTAAFRDRFVPFTLESPEQLRALGAVRDPAAATYRIELLDGQVVERRLAGEAPDTTRLRMGSQRWLFGESASDDRDWRMWKAPTDLPWALQEPGVPFRFRVAPEAEAVVVELRQNNSAAGRSAPSSTPRGHSSNAPAHGTSSSTCG